jgi:hypothetical protein
MRHIDSIQAALLAMIVLASPSMAGDAPQKKLSLTSNRVADSLDRVDASLEVSGKVHVLDEGSELQELKLAVLANLVYDERSLDVPLSPKAPMRSVRHYEHAMAAIEVDNQETHPTLRDDRRLIAVDVDKGKSTLYSPLGPLDHDELDLADIPANTLILDRLLPPYQVAVGESWKQSDELVGLLLGLDAVSSSGVESAVSSVKDSVALVELSGDAQGAIHGVSTEIQVRAKYQFDLLAKRITWFGLLIREKRSVGHVGPGLDIVARLQMKIAPIEESLHLTDGALAGLSLDSSTESSWLAYESVAGEWQLLNDRRWFMTSDDPKAAVFRMIDDGEFVAQCNVSSLPQASVEKLPSLSKFQEDIEAGLGESFGQFISAKQETNDLGYRVFRVVVDGKASEVPIQWIYYLLADKTGRQLTMVFVVEANLIERLAGADEQLAAAAQFVDRTTAARPTLAPK